MARALEGAAWLVLAAIAALNERRSGRSDRSADFRVLARWFAACADDNEAHRLARGAFALNPARHFSLDIDAGIDVPATTRWADAPPLVIHPRLREYGEAAPRGPLPRVRDRTEARARLARELEQESLQVEAARQRLATGRPTHLSSLGELDAHAFSLFLGLLGEALSEQAGPESVAERPTGDGLLHIHLMPLPPDNYAEINTPRGLQLVDSASRAVAKARPALRRNCSAMWPKRLANSRRTAVSLKNTRHWPRPLRNSTNAIAFTPERRAAGKRARCVRPRLNSTAPAERAARLKSGLRAQGAMRRKPRPHIMRRRSHWPANAPASKRWVAARRWKMPTASNWP